MNRFTYPTCLLLLLGLLTCSHADDLFSAVNLNDVRSGELLFVHDAAFYQPATQLSTDVDINISGMVARVTVAQRFQNTGEAFAEALYVFPLPEDAAVDTLRMRIDDRVIEGEIQTREDARENYEIARDAGQQVSLVEQERPNLFTTQLANIPPDAEIIVEISYLETLDYETSDLGGSFSLRFPLAITPRYHPTKVRELSDIDDIMGSDITGHEVVTEHETEETLEADNTGWATATEGSVDDTEISPSSEEPNPRFHSNVEPHHVSIDIELDAGFPLAELESLYHPIEETHTGNRYQIHLAGNDIPADRDFALRWSPEVGDTPAAAIFHEEWRAEPYALVMLMPPSQARDISNLPVQARELIFILDTSGSMDGISIAQAQDALDVALTRLNPYDKFNIIEFNSFATQLYNHSQVAHSENIAQAREWLDQLHANGGTEMLSALELAFADEPSPNYLRQIIFITDGAVGNESELFQAIDAKLGDNRLFTVGIGAAPNSYFMRKAAEFGRGSYTFIGDIAEVQEQMDNLFTKLERPVLTGLEITLPEGSEAFPSTVPDLYAGEPVIMHVKLPDTNGTIELLGEDYGEAWTRSLALRSGGQQDGISQLWAREKIEELRNQRDRSGELMRLQQEITQLALHHHLVSEYTSLIAIDPTITRNEGLPLQQNVIPQNIPHGQNLNGQNGQGFPSPTLAAPLALPAPQPHPVPAPAVMPSPQGAPISSAAMGPIGLQGAAGRTSIGCWDLNGNGAADANEDRNGDGVFDSQDCVGVSNSVGTTGSPSAAALAINQPLEPANKASVTCWDSNGNNQQDNDEDRNGDGIFDIQDCVAGNVMPTSINTDIDEPMDAPINPSCNADLQNTMTPVINALMMDFVEATSNEVHYSFISQASHTTIRDTISDALGETWQFSRTTSRSTRTGNRNTYIYSCDGSERTLHITFGPIGRSLLYNLTARWSE